MRLACSFTTTRLAKVEGKVTAVATGVDLAIVRGDGATRRVERELLACLWVSVHAGDGVVEGWRSIRESPDELWGAGRVVLVVVGDTEAVALAVDVLLVRASVTGNGHSGRLLVGAGDGQELLLGAVVDNVDGTGGGSGDEGHETSGGDGVAHFEYKFVIGLKGSKIVRVIEVLVVEVRD